MSAIRSRQESRVVFDFSEINYSKSKILNILKNIQISEMEFDIDDQEAILLDNYLKVGPYMILLVFYSSCTETYKLSERKNFKVRILDHSKRSDRDVNIQKDNRFCKESWAKKNSGFKYNLSLKDLSEIVFLCKKFEKLNLFS